MVKKFVLSTAPPVVLPEETVILEVVFDVPVSVREVAIDLSVDAVQPGAVRTVYDPETLHRFNTDPSFLSFDDDLWPFVSFVNPAGESDGWAGAWTQRFEIPPGVVSTLEGDYRLDAVCPDGTRGGQSTCRKQGQFHRPAQRVSHDGKSSHQTRGASLVNSPGAFRVTGGWIGAFAPRREAEVRPAEVHPVEVAG